MRLEDTPTSQPPVAAVRPHDVPSPHGTRVDNYYWLRDDSRSQPEVLAYLAAENAYTDAMMAPVKPLEEQLFQEIIARLKQDDATVPVHYRGYWYYTRYETGQEYPIYARKPGSLEAPEEVLLDGNHLAIGHDFFAIGNYTVSPNNRLLAWAEDTVGRRQYAIRVKDLVTDTVLEDTISNAAAALAWLDDNHTLLYIEQDPQTLLGVRVRRHVLGTETTHDALVYEESDPSFYLHVFRSKSERYIFIALRSTVATEWRYAPADDPALSFQIFLPRERDHEYHVDHLEARFLVRTNWQAPNFRMMEVAVGQASDRSHWHDLVPPSAETFVHGFEIFRDYLVVSVRSDGLRKLRVQPWSGGTPHFITADESAYTTFLNNNPEIDTEVVRYAYTSLTTPATIYDYNMRTGEQILRKRDPVLGDFDPAHYVTEYVQAPARDGAHIPVSLVYRREIPRDGTAPLYQYGYGAYGASMDPTFSSARLSLLDRGVVYAVAHVRGGQERGRTWYDQGRLLNKHNTFTDFIDVTDFLVRAGYAARDNIFAAGGSAGGLLMGAVANMAPERYRGIMAHVPFVDIVTTMLDTSISLTTNEYDEWGNPQEAPAYHYMLAYSPYDNVTAQAYPAMLVTAGLWDSQVQYFEPAKWVARLRALKTNHTPLLFHVNMEAGHGGQSGRFRRYREVAMEYAFLLGQLGMSS